ncbi:MAG: CoA pyrophosphatase [Sphingobacteriales bacterium]|jgi:8-oxo-dGTP pyrophosphatase MutT (NUDIX family)|nr:MAG: CoA pyrophosphatase [Sphingobacteriales bacterium]
MHFNQILAKISTTIESNKLPGVLAHQIMQPYYSNAKNFTIPTNPLAKKSAVLILVFKKEDEPYVLFIERPENTGVHSGQISFPGGKVEPSDINYIDTALRETEEEVGIQRSEIEVLGSMSKVFVAASNFIIYPIVGYMQQPPNYITNVEVKRVLEVPLAYLQQAKIEEKPIKSGIGIVLQAPYITIEDKILWGATAMITSELIHITR